MFNVYDNEGAPMLDNDKVRFLYKRFQQLGLKIEVESLKNMHMMVTDVTYTMDLNHLYTEVLQLTE